MVINYLLSQLSGTGSATGFGNLKGRKQSKNWRVSESKEEKDIGRREVLKKWKNFPSSSWYEYPYSERNMERILENLRERKREFEREEEMKERSGGRWLMPLVSWVVRAYDFISFLFFSLLFFVQNFLPLVLTRKNSLASIILPLLIFFPFLCLSLLFFSSDVSSRLSFNCSFLLLLPPLFCSSF